MDLHALGVLTIAESVVFVLVFALTTPLSRIAKEEPARTPFEAVDKYAPLGIMGLIVSPYATVPTTILLGSWVELGVITTLTFILGYLWVIAANYSEEVVRRSLRGSHNEATTC